MEQRIIPFWPLFRTEHDTWWMYQRSEETEDATYTALGEKGKMILRTTIAEKHGCVK
jgi:hypothetical protein